MQERLVFEIVTNLENKQCGKSKPISLFYQDYNISQL